MAARTFLLNTEVIRDLLDRQHRSHWGFADDLEISRSYWSQLFNRRRHLTPELRRRLLEHDLVRSAKLHEQDLWTINEPP